MSWERFELGLRILENEERRAFVAASRAHRLAQHAERKDFEASIKGEKILAGMIDG